MSLMNKSTFVLAIILICIAVGGCSIIDAYVKLRQAKDEQLKKAELASRPKTFEMTRLNPDGGIDSSFGDNGKVIVDPTITPQEKQTFLEQILVLQDNKIAVKYGKDILLFDANGLLENRIKPDSFFDKFIHVQPDKKLLVAEERSEYYEYEEGGESPRRHHISLGRFNADGTKDLRFGKDGKIETKLKYSFSDTIAFAVLPDEKMLLAGNDYGGPLTVLRFDKDGTPDASFGNQGTISQPEDFISLYPTPQIILQKNAKFVVVAGLKTITLFRHNADGTPDRSFAGDWILETDFENNGSTKTAVQDSKGNLLVGGWTDGQYVLRRYNKNGELDVNFNNGKQVVVEAVKMPDGAREYLVLEFLWQSVLLQRDGKILVAFRRPCLPKCYYQYNLDETFSIQRYDENGTLDKTFGNEGKVSFVGYIKQIFLQENQRILVAGSLVEMQNK